MGNDIAIASLKEKIDDLNHQAWQVRVSDSTKAFELSQQSVKLARTINYTKGLAEGLRSLGFGYIRLFKNNEAAPVLRESLSLFQFLDDLQGQAVVYEYLGIIERNWGNLGHSLELLLKGNELVQQVGSMEVEITSCYQIGVTYKHLGDHENALDYLYRSLSLAQQTDLVLMEAYATNIIGSIYFDNGNYEKAQELYRRGLIIRRQSNDKWGEAGSLDNIGITYLKLNHLDKAIDYCMQSLEISQTIADKKGEANALLHLAEIYEKANDRMQAAKYSNESLQIRKASGDKRGEAEVLLFLAELHKNTKVINDQQLYEWISGALNIANEIRSQDLLSNALFNLHEYYHRKENYRESLVHLQAHLQIEKELHKNAIVQKVSNLEISHKAEVISLRNKELTELNEKIEKANEELQIEASLERVRAVSMSMSKPDDILNICKVMFAELQTLGFKDLRNSLINFWDDDNGVLLDYDYSDFSGGNFAKLSYSSHPVFEAFQKKVRKATDAFAELIVTENELETWKQRRKDSGEYEDPRLDNISALYYYFYSTGVGALGISTFSPISKDKLDVLKRFRNVFDLTYRRYLDIVKAEAQAREAQIELALERVRARTMAMQKSDELAEAAQLLYHEFGTLGLDPFTCGYLFIKEEQNKQTAWVTLPDGTLIPDYIDFPLTGDHILDNRYKSWKQKESLHKIELHGEENKEHHRFLASKVPAQVANEIFAQIPERIFVYCANFSAGYLFIIATKLFSSEAEQTIIRFAKVFEMTYTRFLDLKQAEAQAREAQIELGLERVRARAMAMQKSDELSELVDTVFKELTKLDFALNWCIINIIDESSLSNTVWAANPDINKAPESYHMLFEDYPFHHAMMKGWKERNTKCVYVLEGKEKKVYDEYLFNETEFRRVPEAAQAASRAMEKYVVTFTFSNFGGLQTVGAVPLSEANIDILSRFGKVFDLTYTRFNDLKKAEAQTREAQIEVSVERVRAKALAMHKSEDLHSVVVALKKELMSLQIPGVTASTIYLEQEDGSIRILDISDTGEQEDDPSHFKMDKVIRLEDTDPDLWIRRIWNGTENYFVVEADEADFKRVIAWLYTIDKEGAKIAEKIIQEKSIKRAWLPTVKLEKGRMNIDLLEPPAPEIESILLKMGAGFDLAYKRFVDLQKAEAQAREATIEVALERVRARALAMQQPEELKDVATVLRTEMGLLGIEELETCSIYIHEKDSETAECWYALKETKDANRKMIADHFHLNLHDTWVGREMKSFYDSHDKQSSILMKGANRIEWINYCYQRSPVLAGFYGDKIPDRTYHLYRFSHGYIGAAAPGDISPESWKLLSRAASVFSLAYSRFRDLTQARNDLIQLKEEKKRAEDALTELQNTQKQLIQTEKMASLGELTAGIAHEIQNPLNFVNNFSDVSHELLEEMKTELATGNTQQAMEIANDVKENLEKILHHGKRADAIVKGMLQHSRSSSGVKEPTDINNLADEYLRLAFHGYRAKDKSFNAKFETHFDNRLEKVNVIPQDIGRVILNLINNAFYTVNEKRKQVANDYEPTVIVTTKKIDNRVEISVRDNGNGIPQKMLDKIFQPFFTTKPTGQGTGLGLSLSYDIITKGHAGDIEVKTEEGRGTEFIISLPVT